MEQNAAAKAHKEYIDNLRATLRKEPLFQASEAAYMLLRDKGCNMMKVQRYLDDIVGYKSGNMGKYQRRQPRKEIARKLRAIAKQLRKGAQEIEALRNVWSFKQRMLDSAAYHCPEGLLEMANQLTQTRTQGFGDWHPQREAILGLLHLVESETGRYHYPQVSNLINAEMVWKARVYKQPIPEPRFDVDSLKMMIQRWGRERRQQSKRWPLCKDDLADTSEREDVTLA
jgi:hypothetical protein